MSVTTNERANPPPRRKSCAACTRAKRRCDLAHPTCTRCAGRGLACHYPPRRGSPRSPLPSPHSATNAATPDFSIDDLLDDFWTRDVCAADPLPFQDFGAPPAPTVEMPAQGDGSGQAQPPGPIDMNDVLIMDAERQLVRIRGGLAGSGVGDRVECVPHFLGERLTYVFEYLPETPKEMVDTMGTPWCHPMAFKDHTPKAFEDVLSACALYSSRNPANKPIIMRIILSRMRDLAATPSPPDPYDALARTLALGMYHIMALLDGDIEARATAETTLPSLEPAAISLLPHINLDSEATYPPTLPLYPLDETESFWKAWVLSESLRRTTLFVHQFVACYALVKGATSVDCSDLARFQSWTLSAPLWHARNAVDFAVAWGSKNRLLINVTKCETAFEGAGVDDVCQFGKLLMSSFLGYQQARGWFAARGGVF